jgi:hypothetical protein
VFTQTFTDSISQRLWNVEALVSLNVGYCSWVYGVSGDSVEMDMCVVSVLS